MLLFGKKNGPGDTFPETERAEALIRETTERMNRTPKELILKLQLKDDIKYLEQKLSRYRKDPSGKNKEELISYTERLKTTSEHILDWKFEE